MNKREGSPGEDWCDVLERFGLDGEQAEVLTRIAVERAVAWASQWASLVSKEETYGTLVPRPMDPDVLRRGLELWKRRKAQGTDRAPV